MFWRLFIAFNLFTLLGSLSVGAFFLVTLRHDLDTDWLKGFIPYALLLPLFSLLPAYWIARRVVQPFQRLSEGAKRIAEGEYGHRIPSGIWMESNQLARTFNQMSKRLAEQFAQLETDRKQLRTILGGMIEGVIALDAEQNILFANQMAGKMLDFRPESAVGRKFWEITRNPQIQDLIQKAVQGAEPNRLELDLKGGSSRYLVLYVAPMPNQNLQHGAVLVAHDTSELRRLERLRQEFVANVSHELKTPLSVIKACVEALLDGAIDDIEARQPFLEQVSEQAERLHLLILDLLSLARIESGADFLEFQNVFLDQIVLECLERHRPRADAKSISLEPHTPDGQVVVWGEEEAIGQILDNLIDNAVKYTHPGGKIKVQCQAVENEVLLQVEDNGTGIPERDLPRIFERFYRVDKARSRALGGTGLGLAIVKHLVQAMNGTVKATSQLGKGTTFHVRFPKQNHT